LLLPSGHPRSLVVINQVKTVQARREFKIHPVPFLSFVPFLVCSPELLGRTAAH
jgi:hypothetical protein